MKRPLRRLDIANEALFGATLLSVIALHGYMLFLLVRGRAAMDGLAPRVDDRAA
jgi:hypothetical protein